MIGVLVASDNVNKFFLMINGKFFNLNINDISMGGGVFMTHIH